MAGEVKIPVKDGEIPAYRALPEKEGEFPVVLVVQEIFGVHEHIKDVCRRFAKLGYLAMAPELYARQGDVSKMTDFNEILAKVVSKVPDAQVMSDLDAAVAWAKGPAKGTRAARRSPASAGAGGSSGSTRRTTRTSRRASPGTAASSANATAPAAEAPGRRRRRP